MAINVPVEYPDLRVAVNDVLYMPSLNAPPERPHPFVYFISMRNEGEETIIIRARKWIVEEDGGLIFVVEGDGVVGKTPRLAPGENFKYNSYHVVATGGRASGAFFGLTAGGRVIFARIPPFVMTVPPWA